MSVGCVKLCWLWTLNDLLLAMSHLSTFIIVYSSEWQCQCEWKVQQVSFLISSSSSRPTSIYVFRDFWQDQQTWELKHRYGAKASLFLAYILKQCFAENSKRVQLLRWDEMGIFVKSLLMLNYNIVWRKKKQ